MAANQYAQQAPKLGRQGYALTFIKFEGENPWSWQVETQNGVVIADSTRAYRSRWDARRSAIRLLGDAVTSERTVYTQFA